jgi:hypothetical protein
VNLYSNNQTGGPNAPGYAVSVTLLSGSTVVATGDPIVSNAAEVPNGAQSSYALQGSTPLSTGGQQAPDAAPAADLVVPSGSYTARITVFGGYCGYATPMSVATNGGSFTITTAYAG